MARELPASDDKLR